ncbi:hypothetical protein Tco_0474029 [Tanacetum coccineum]
MTVRRMINQGLNIDQFLKIMFKQLRLEIGLKDALIEMPKFNKWLCSLLRNKEKLEEIAITTVNAECSAIIMNKVPDKLEDPGKFLIPCALQELDRTTISVINFSKDDPFSGSTTTHSDDPSPSSSPVSKILKFLRNGAERDVEIKNSKHFPISQFYLTYLLSNKVECFTPEDDIDEIDAFLAMEVSSNFEEEQNESSITFSPRSDPLHHEFTSELLTLPSRKSEPAQEEIDIFLVPDDLIPPGVENDDSEDEIMS